MANTPPNLRASGTIRACRIVKVSGNYTGAEADANELPIGITWQDGKYPPLNDLVSSNPHAESGDPIRLYGDGDICLVELGDTVVANGRVKSDADGKAVPIATTGTTIQHFVGRMLEGGSSGEKRLVQILIGSERPALA